MKTRDLSAPAGRRLRIRIDYYDRQKQVFRPVRGYGSTFNISGEGNLEKLWTRVNQAIRAFLVELGQEPPPQEGAPDAAGDSGSDNAAAGR